MNGKAVAYYRVSTDRQGRSGLGLDAQRRAVANFLAGPAKMILGEFTEVESGKINDRPQLQAALALCRLTGATLVVAKLDRLARNARFLLNVVEGSGEGGVVFCDLPQLPPGPVGKFMLTQMAAVAELEAGLISQRTKAALSAAKGRGKILGGYRAGAPKVDGALGNVAKQRKADAFAATVGPIAKSLLDEGKSLRAIASALTDRGIRTPRGGSWTAGAVKNVVARMAA
ncbi:DNA-invertase [Roseomonas mucosa]|uniref:DNA-invertase n=1 Tax=Roseomonas mucosa TaxID=207340 RepID=A0A4Y1MZC1_9PROT|nr:DNA-invertase [Roseomonas mucosa]